MPLVRKPTTPARELTPAAASVRKGLESSSADERWAAARAAADAKLEPAVLGATLRAETDSRVREALFTSLARIGTSESGYELLALLRSDDASLRTGALDALRMMLPAVRELLPKLLSDPDVDIRILSCELARALPNEEATALLCTALVSEPQLNVCAAAIEVLSEVGTSQALPVLAACGRRFAAAPFLEFAIQVATDRIRSQSALDRG